MYREVIKLATPLILSQGMQTLMVLTDRYILSLKNPLFTSAATTGGFTASSACYFFVHLLLFSTSLIAKHYGSKQYNKCHIIAWQCITLATFCIPLLFLISLSGEAYFRFLEHPLSYRQIETEYYKIYVYSFIPVLYRTAIECYYLGIGKSQKIFYASFIGVIVNIPLSYIFVSGPLSFLFSGASGVAWGTLFANTVSLIFLGVVFFREVLKTKMRVHWRDLWDSQDLFPLLTQGTSSGLEKFFNSFCFITFVNMFVFYGSEVSTGISIVFSWDQIAFLPLMGIYGALLSLYSRYLGENNPNQAIKALHCALTLTIGLMSIFSLFFFLFRDLLTSLFLQGTNHSLELDQVYFHTDIFFKTTSIYIFANTGIFLYKAALRSLGYSVWCFKLSFIIHTILVVTSYAAVYVFHISPIGVWSIFVGMLLLLSVSFALKYHDSLHYITAEAEASPP